MVRLYKKLIEHDVMLRVEPRGEDLIFTAWKDGFVKDVTIPVVLIETKPVETEELLIKLVELAVDAYYRLFPGMKLEG